MTPGFLTSEFVLTLIVVLVAAASALIQVWRGQLDGMGALSLMSAALVTASYAIGRSRVKNGTTNGNGNGNGNGHTNGDSLPREAGEGRGGGPKA